MAKRSSRKTTAVDQPAPVTATQDVEQRPSETIAVDPVLRQNAPIHCPYCKTPCEPKSDALFTTYRCVNRECGISYTNKVARPRLSQRLGKKPEDDTMSAR
jgi:hypothetical protein